MPFDAISYSLGKRALRQALQAITETEHAGIVHTSAMIGDGEVNTPDLADLGVTAAKLAELAVTTPKLADLSVTTPKLADASVTIPKLGFRTWETISDWTAAADVTYHTFTGLDVNTDGAYTLYWNTINPTATGGNVYVFFEGDTTTTNYYTQYTAMEGTSITLVRINVPRLGWTDAGGVAGGIAWIYRGLDGRIRAMVKWAYRAGASIIASFCWVCQVPVKANLTMLTISHQRSGGIGAGSRFILCRPRT